MKVIDLLNKIAKGEEVPKKIKYENEIFTYRNINREGIKYINESRELDDEFRHLMYCVENLNYEIEIIEEKEIEIKQEYTNKGKLHDYLYYKGSKYQLSLPQILLFKEIETIKNELNKIKKEGK